MCRSPFIRRGLFIRRGPIFAEVPSFTRFDRQARGQYRLGVAAGLVQHALIEVFGLGQIRARKLNQLHRDIFEVDAAQIGAGEVSPDDPAARARLHGRRARG